MIPDVTIRQESPNDAKAIHDLTRDAFAPKSFSNGSEASAIGKMRDAGQLILSLVAETDRIIGHVAFSVVMVSQAEGDWYGLGPIAVEEQFQRQGLGKQLVEAGLAALAQKDAAGCILTGNPDIYQQMGFTNDHALTYGKLNPRYILYRSLNGSIPKGTVAFVSPMEEDHT